MQRFEWSAMPDVVNRDDIRHSCTPKDRFGKIAAGAVVSVDEVDLMPVDDLDQPPVSRQFVKRIQALKGQPVLSHHTGREIPGTGMPACCDEENMMAAKAEFLHQLKGMGLRSSGSSAAPAMGEEHENVQPCGAGERIG